MGDESKVGSSKEEACVVEGKEFSLNGGRVEYLQMFFT